MKSNYILGLGTDLIEEKKNYRMNCPQCHIRFPQLHPDTKYKLYIDKFKDRFHCFRCDWSGKTSVHLRLFLHQPLAKMEDTETYSYSIDLDSISKPLVVDSKEFRYLENRMRHNKDELYSNVYQFRIGKNSFINRVIIPSFDITGKPNYFIGRSITNDPIKYKNCTLPKTDVVYNIDKVDGSKLCFLTEGVFSGYPFGHDSFVSIFGNSISDVQAKIIRYKINKLVFVADYGVPDKKSAKNLLTLLNAGFSLDDLFFYICPKQSLKDTELLSYRFDSSSSFKEYVISQSIPAQTFLSSVLSDWSTRYEFMKEKLLSKELLNLILS